MPQMLPIDAYSSSGEHTHDGNSSFAHQPAPSQRQNLEGTADVQLQAPESQAAHSSSFASTAGSAVGDSGTSNITRVDGKGLWRSWKRNFNSQFTAILDLIDNSLDASITNKQHPFRGRCHIAPDTISTSTDSISDSDWTTAKTTGITIVNNCFDPPRPLYRCLEIYDSSKVDSGKDSVGENGVGLKQACATLSDTNFVFVKSVLNSQGDDDSDGSDLLGGDKTTMTIRCELGFVAEVLQKVEGAYLPAFQFTVEAKLNEINNDNNSMISSLRQQMKSLFSQPQHRQIAQCIAGYGEPLNNNPDDDNNNSSSNESLNLGIHRLCQQFHKLCTDFQESPYVFAVIVDKIRNDNVEERTGVAGDALTVIHVENLMDELKNKIPMTYLHIPGSFDFRVGDDPINFSYWQKRMVEFSSFNIEVGTTMQFDDPRDDPQKCLIRVFCGFDAVAMNDKTAKKCASLYLYSRQSGRLITHHVDARTMLGLNAGGSEFCSGLRVIIDDFDGYLPLNPTKQEIAFSEKACGHILKENLFTWVGAVADMFYKYHITKFDKKKLVLTKKIKEYGNEISQKDELQTELGDLDLTSFVVSNKKIVKTSVGGISLRLKGDEKVGADTIYRLLPDQSTPSSSPIPEPAATQSASTTTQSTEHVSKKRKLLSSSPSTFTCRACQKLNDIARASCMHCSAVRPGSLVEETGHVVTQPVQAPAAPTNYQYNQRSAHQYPQQTHALRNQHLLLLQNAHASATHGHGVPPHVVAQSLQAPAAHAIPTIYQSNQRDSSSVQCDQYSQQTQTLQYQHPSPPPNENNDQNMSSAASAPHDPSSETAAHYESLCSQLTQKLEKVNAKSERRKKNYNEMVQRNAMLEEEVRELKARNASLERELLLRDER